MSRTAMPRNFAATALKLIVASLIVGLILSLFGASPLTLLKGASESLFAVFDWLVGAVQWAVPYIILGAILVLPIWLVLLLVRLVRGRRRS